MSSNQQDPPGTGGNGSNGGGGCDDETRITDLLVNSFETSVRTAYCLARIPLVCYASMLESWCKAAEAATNQCDASLRKNRRG